MPDSHQDNQEGTRKPSASSDLPTETETPTIIPPAIASALSVLQGEVKTVIKGAKNDHYGNTYAELKDVQEIALPLLSKHGLTLTQWPVSRDGTFYLRSYLAHKSGVGMVDEIELMLSKRDAQGLGSAITYERRQTTMAILGLSPEDDDGNRAANRHIKPTADQLSEIRQLCVDLKFPPDQVATRLGSLRTEDQATVVLATLHKMIGERATIIRDEATAIPVFTGDRDQVIPTEVIAGSSGSVDAVANLQTHILALPITDKAKRGLVRHVTKKPFLKNCTPEEVTAVAEVVEAIKDGTYEMPASWTNAEIAPPEEAA